MKIITIFLITYAFLALQPASAQGYQSSPFPSEDDINFYCLRESYPKITRLEKSPDGAQWLYLADGQRIPYVGFAGSGAALAVDVKQSMAQPYALEPERQETPPGYAPGRKRSYELLSALYGSSAQAVRHNLVSARFQGRAVNLAAPAAAAFSRVATKLQALVAKDESLKSFLIPDGGFMWRKIAGENVQSAHSYGIALDLGASKAPYWRWSKTRPHPMQKTYPEEIVMAFEDEGFIWGGKWHEYDLMHFEYRPELICKAKLMRQKRSNKTAPF